MKHFKRPLAWILSLSMVASYIPPSYADELDNSTPIPEESSLVTSDSSENMESTGTADSAYTYADFRASIEGKITNDKKTAYDPSSSSSYTFVEEIQSENEFLDDYLVESLYLTPIPGEGEGAGFQDESEATTLDVTATETTYGFETDDTNEITVYYDSIIDQKEGTAQLVAQGEHSNFWVIEALNDTGIVGDDTKPTQNASNISTDYKNDLVDNGTEEDKATITATATDEKLLPMVEYVDNIYKKMTQVSPHDKVTVETNYGNVPLVGDVDGDGKINVIMYDFGNHTSTVGYFSNACYFKETTANNTPLDAIHMDFDGFDELADSNFYGTVAHELQHLMYYTYLGVYMPSDMNTTWINEALSGVPDMFYAGGSAYEGMNGQNLSVSRMAAGTVNSYENGSRYGDFVNFNNSSKNYGMSYMFSAFMMEIDEEYYTKMYEYFQNNVEGKSFAEGQNVYKYEADEDGSKEYKSMEVIFGEAFKYVLGGSAAEDISAKEDGSDLAWVSDLEAETVFEYVYTAFMESYISGGGDVILADGSTFTTSQITKAPYATLWSSRNGNVALIGEVKVENANGTTSTGYRRAEINALYPTLYSSDSDETDLLTEISLSGYGTTSKPSTGATHEMVYILDTTDYVAEAEEDLITVDGNEKDSTTADYLSIKVGDTDSTGFLAYVALYDSTTAPVTKPGDSLVFGGDINNDHADIYPLTLGVEQKIYVANKNIVPHLFVVSYFGDVTTSASFDWVSAEDILEDSDIELDLDEESFTVEDNEITVPTGDEIDLADLFASLNGVAEQIQAVFHEKATVSYYKSSANSSEAGIASISEGDEWVLIDDEEGGKTAEALAKEQLETPGNQVKVEYTVSSVADPVVTYTLIADETVVMYDITVDVNDNDFGTVEVVVTAPVVEEISTQEAEAEAEEDDQKAQEGYTVTVTVAPEDGYKVSLVDATFLENGEETTPESFDQSADRDDTYTFEMPAADVTISVEFSEIQSVTLDYGEYEVDDDEPTSFELNDDGTIKDFESLPTFDDGMEGYVFLGWYTKQTGYDEDDLVEETTDLTDVDTIYAIWEIITYTVTFNYNYDGAVDPGKLVVDHGSIIPQLGFSELGVPTRTGYVIEGWYESQTPIDLDDYWNFNEDTVTGDVTLYINWEKESYTVTFMNGEDEFASQDVLYEEKITTITPPVKTGYDFEYWATKDGVTFTEWDFDTKITENTELYAVWEIKTFEVTFDLGLDDYADPDSQTIEYDSLVEEPEITDLEEWETVEWYSDEEYETLWVFDEHTVTDEITLYGKVVVATYTVTFVYGDDVTEDYTEEVEHGKVITEMTDDEKAPTRTGYDFVGWYDTATPDVDDTEWRFETAIEEVTELYAVWEIQTFEVTFDLDHDDYADPDSQTIEYDSLVEEPEVTGLEAWETVEWYRDVDRTTPWVFDEHTVTDEITLYGKVVIATYSVTFNLNYGDTIFYSETVEHGNTITEASFPTDDPERTGYDFVGWYTKDESDVETEWDFASEITADTELFAVWDAKAYDITFNTVAIDGLTFIETTDEYKFDGKLTAPTVVGDVKEGHYVAWFYTLNDVEKEWDFANDTVFDNLTLSAKLEKITYTVTFDYQDDDTDDLKVFVKYDDLIDEDDVPADPTWAGYDFVDWYGVSVPGDDDVAWDFETNTITADTTLFAVWEIGEYEITLVNTTGGTISIGDETENLSLTTDGSWHIDLNSVTATPSQDYQFDGWFDAETGGVKVDSTTVFTQTSTIYARWSLIPVDVTTYTITLDENFPDESGSTSPEVTSTSGTLTTEQLTAPTAPEGYQFDGWYDAASGGNKITAETIFKANDTIYAQWTVKDSSDTSPEVVTYTITLVSGENGTIKTESLETDGDGKITQDMLDAVVKAADENYEFLGWFTDEEGEEELDLNTVYTDDDTIYGLWAEQAKVDSVTITLVSGENGTITTETLETNDYGKLTQTMLDAVEKEADEGYEFKGWYADAEGTTALDLSTVYQEASTIYGLWEEESSDSDEEGEDGDPDDEEAPEPEEETDPETDAAPEKYSLWGKVTDSSGVVLENVTITLKQNGTTLETVTSNAFGNYYLVGNYTGYYNLVFYDGSKTKTVAVYLASSSTTISTIAMPSHNINTILGISTKTYVDAVAGLDSLADLMSTTLKTAVNLEMEITSSTSDENKELIDTVLGRDNEIISYFDVDLYQRTYSDSTMTNETAVTSTDSLLQIFVEIPSDYRDLDKYFVYRLHDNDLDILSTSSNSQNERIVISDDGATLTIYTRNFSTYALVCEKETTGGGGVTGPTYPVIIDRLADGEASTSAAVGTVGFSTSNPATGALVTVTPYPGVGYALDYVTASTEDGTSIHLVNRGDGSYTFIQGTSTVTLTVAFVTYEVDETPAYTLFNDVGVMDPKCSAINKVVDLGLMTGVTAYTFAPNDSITRGMIATILYKLSGTHSYGSGQFTDVKTTDYYYNAVAWAKEMGIVSGYADGTFRPNQAVTREELAVIFDSYCTKMNLASYVWLFPNEFVDNKYIGAWASNSVNFCTNLGIMDSQENFFQPNTYATRGDVAVSLVVLYDFS